MNRLLDRAPLALLGALACLPAGHAVAADRALLIGVGDYRDPDVNDLPGIDLDIGIMQRVAQRLGFAQDDTRVLLDSDATLGGVERAMRDWLVDGVSADDRVLIYYSGHGAQIQDRDGDESDGLDEILILHDFGPDEDGAPPGALVDDRFFELLSEIPTDDVLLVVDACHSGSGYKNLLGSSIGAERGVPKTWVSATLPSAGNDPFATADKGSEARFAALMAAADDEVAIATPRGSLFTLGVERAIEAAAAAGGTITPRGVIASSTRFIQAETRGDSSETFTPQLGGSEALADRPLRLMSGNPLRDELAAFVARQPPLEITSNKPSYPIGDLSLRVSVEVPAAGYLNIVTVDPAGTAVVLYPNRFDRDNRVEAGALAVPTPAMDFDLRADGPVGEHLVAALWTPGPLDLYESGFGERDANGQLLQDFAELNEAGKRAFEPVEREKGVPGRAGSIVLEMRP